MALIFLQAERRERYTTTLCPPLYVLHSFTHSFIHLFIYLFMYACSILKFLFLDFRPFVSILPHLYGRQTELHTEM